MFDTYFSSDSPLAWLRILYRDRAGAVQQGWIVANPDAITGIKLCVFDDTSEDAYHGEARGVGLCESLSVGDQPDAASKRIQPMTYGRYCIAQICFCFVYAG